MYVLPSPSPYLCNKNFVSKSSLCVSLAPAFANPLVENRERERNGQLLIGATASSILSSLGEDATWDNAKETLLYRLGIGSVKDEAWQALKNLKKGSKEIVELAGEAGKLAKRLHPRDEEAVERHAIDAVFGCGRATSRRRGTEVGVPHYGRCGRRGQANREDPRGADGLQDRASHILHAGSNQSP